MEASYVFSFGRRELANATGHQLDSYGDEVGIKRCFGESDYSFRNKVNTLVSGEPIFNGAAKETMASDATLRDYFAAKALQGMLSALDASGLNYSNPEMMAEHAFVFADKMLAERAK